MLKVCAEVGCFTLTADSRCETHQRKPWQGYEERHPEERREKERFYGSKAWKAFRAMILRERPRCERCRRKATTVHHIKPRLEYPELALDERNAEALCKQCHDVHEGRHRASPTSGAGQSTQSRGGEG